MESKGLLELQRLDLEENGIDYKELTVMGKSLHSWFDKMTNAELIFLEYGIR